MHKYENKKSDKEIDSEDLTNDGLIEELENMDTNSADEGSEAEEVLSEDGEEITEYNDPDIRNGPGPSATQNPEKDAKTFAGMIKRKYKRRGYFKLTSPGTEK